MITSKKLFVALSIALAFLGLLGCGTTNHLQTITLTSGSSTGSFELKGLGGTLQLKAIGNYSSMGTHDLTNVVTYTISADQLAGGPVLAAPPQTVSLNATGLLTAVEPAVCTYVNVETDPKLPPVWALSGSYKVVATFGAITSQPIYVAVASAAGGPPSGACGP